MGNCIITNRVPSTNDLKQAYAIIFVLYPAGSILTCSNGQKTFRAGNTSGMWAFSIPHNDVWEIIAENSEYTTSKNIEITESGQVEEVILQYYLPLYDKRGQHEDITGGWGKSTTQSGGGATVNFGPSELSISSYGSYYDGSYGYAAASTLQPIDVTDYRTLSCYATKSTKVTIGLSSTKVTASSANWVSHVSMNAGGIYTIDISQIVGSYYIGLRAISGTDQSAGGTFKEIRIDP